MKISFVLLATTAAAVLQAQPAVNVSHSNSYFRAQANAVSLVRVTSTGAGAFNLALNPDPNFTVTAINANANWTCNLGSLACSRPTSSGAIFEFIQLVGTVNAGAPATITNQATLTGTGLSSPLTVSDSVPVYAPSKVIQWGSTALSQRTNLPSTPGLTAVAAGLDHQIALASDGSIVQWGNTANGQANNLPTSKGFLAIAAGSSHNIAITGDGHLTMWGANNVGQQSGLPTNAGFIAVAANAYYTMALTNDGHIVMWGSQANTTGIPTSGGYIAIASGYDHGIALTADGYISQWGATNVSQNSGLPTDGGYIAISAGEYTGMAQRANGTIVQWGSNDNGALSGTPTASVQSSGSGAEDYGSWAMASNGSIVEWGGVSGASNGLPSYGGFAYNSAVLGGSITAALLPLANPSLNGGGGQSANINAAFTTPLSVKVLDAAGNPAQGVNIVFTAPGSGASGTFSNGTATITVATDVTGTASATFTANGSGGQYNVTASYPGLTSVTFTETNLVPVTITVPAAVSFTFNGTSYTGPQSFYVAPGQYPLSTAAETPVSGGSDLVFSSWSDGGAISHNVTIGSAGAAITGTFITEACSLVVTSTADSGAGSLRDAVANLCPGGTVTFDPTAFATPQTITLASRILLNQNITIQGNGNVTISGNNATRIFFVGSGTTSAFSGTVAISGVTLENGYGQGGAGGGGGGGAAGMGGAIFQNGGTLTLTNVQFQGNQAVGGANSVSGASGSGGGFGGNGNANNGGSGGDLGGAGGAEGGNNGGAGGGGGWAPFGNGGSGGFGGGGGFGRNLSSPNASGGNGGFGAGGGSSENNQDTSSIPGASGWGAGSPSGFSGGPGGAFGGAIFTLSGTLTLNSASFSNNQASATGAQGKGGALFIYSGATATASGVTFSGNTAAAAGSPGTGNSAAPYTNGSTCPGVDNTDVCGQLGGNVLSVTISGTGTVSDGGTLSCSSGTCSEYGNGTVTLTATPGANQTFVGFTGGGCSTSPCTVSLAGGNVSVTATFATSTSPSITLNPANVTVNAGQTATFTAAASGTPTPTVAWYASTDGIDFYYMGVTSTTLSFVATASQNGMSYYAGFTNTAGSVDTKTVTLTVDYAPTVTTNPVSQSISAGSNVTFIAAASGNPTPTVQWQVSTNGTTFTNISGATSPTLSFTTAVGQNGNQFRAVFSNSVGSATTTAATLTVTVTASPVITLNPANATVNAGQTATFTASASGTPTPTVSWYSSPDGINFYYMGVTSTTLSFVATASQNATYYYAVFTNTAGSVTTTTAMLTVDYAPSVTTNPVSQSISAGSNVSFTAAASGNPTPTVQWYVSTNNGSTFTAIGGATSPTLSLTSVPVSANGNQYKATFLNSVGSATTIPATLTVTASPVITLNPANVTVNAGQTATFTAAASGTPTPTVAWYASTDGVNFYYMGVTSTTLSFVATASQNGMSYYAVFTNTAGSADTKTVTLTVNSAPTVTTNPVSQSISAGSNVTFLAAASGNPTPTVQWQVSTNGTTFTNISGATSAVLSFTSSAGQNGNQYRAVFTNTAGSATTTAAVLTVTFAPTVTTNPVGQSITAGSNVSFTAAANGNPTPAVQWYISTNGGATFTPIGGATSTTLSLTGVPATANGNQYRAAFTNSAGSATTTAATLTVNTVVLTTVTSLTSTVANGGYGTGATIPVVITFSAPVIVTGTPQLALNSSGTASYTGGSGTASLTFTYTVLAGQNSAHLDATSTTALTLNGGTIVDGSSNAAVLTLPAPGAAGSLGANKAIVINTNAPTVVSFNVLWGSQSYNVIGTTRNRLPWQITGIQVVFSEPIASGDLSSLSGVTATALSGLGTNTLTWTIPATPDGALALTLAGSGPNALLDADGNALGGGAGFTQNLKILYGDYNDDGAVNILDQTAVLGVSRAAYNILADMNGDGVVNVTDVTLVRSQIGNNLP